MFNIFTMITESLNKSREIRTYGDIGKEYNPSTDLSSSTDSKPQLPSNINPYEVFYDLGNSQQEIFENLKYADTNRLNRFG